MKITVAKNDLEAALQVASIGVSNSGNDLSTHFLFREREGNIQVLSYSQRVCTASPVTCQHDAEQDEAMTIEGWRLLKWLSVVGDVPVTLENTTKGEVTVSSPRSKIRIKSLDATKFPFFDKSLDDAKEVATLSADRLVSALNYIRSFISDKGSNDRPDVAQIEVLDGVMWATDKRAVTMITLDGLKDSNLRIHGQDIPSVTKFLSNKDTQEVTLLEHDRSLFLRRQDGALVGCSRPLVKFPDIPVPKVQNDQMFWTVRAESLLMGINVLEASADKGNTRIGLAWADDQVQLKVTSAVGGEDSFPLDVVESEGLDDLPDGGFLMDYPYITHIIGHFGDDEIKFGLNRLKSGGYVRFAHEVDKDSYVTVVAWR